MSKFKVDNYETSLNYDKENNIITKREKIGEDSYTYNYSYNNESVLTNLNILDNNSNYDYDKLGRLTESSINDTYKMKYNYITNGNKTLTWKNGRELALYNYGTNNITYKYNIDGIRTEKIVNGITTKYHLEGSKIIFEGRNGIMIYFIYNGDELLGFKYNDITYYYHKNMFDDVVGILDVNYNEIVTYEYDSWGNILSVVDNSGINLSIINPYR